MQKTLLSAIRKDYAEFLRAKEKHYLNLALIRSEIDPVIEKTLTEQLGTNEFQWMGAHDGGCFGDNWDIRYVVVTYQGHVANPESKSWQRSLSHRNVPTVPDRTIDEVKSICHFISEECGIEVTLYESIYNTF